MGSYRFVSDMSSNAKTAKMLEELNLDGVILYLAPSNLSGVTNVCPMASPGCAAACLNTAGLGVFSNVQAARKRKTVLFASDRDTFMQNIVDDLERLIRRAARRGRKPVARLNGTSDISYERIPVTRGGVVYLNIFNAFPFVQFYDYTKNVTRLERCRDIPNYSLTFSLSESNDQHAARALDLGFNVAAVIKDPQNVWGGFPTIDGDKNDFRFLDPKGGHIVALKAKGKARYDTSGFVRDAFDAINIDRTPVFGRAA